MSTRKWKKTPIFCPLKLFFYFAFLITHYKFHSFLFLFFSFYLLLLFFCVDAGAFFSSLLPFPDNLVFTSSSSLRDPKSASSASHFPKTIHSLLIHQKAAFFLLPFLLASNSDSIRLSFFSSFFLSFVNFFLVSLCL